MASAFLPPERSDMGTRIDNRVGWLSCWMPIFLIFILTQCAGGKKKTFDIYPFFVHALLFQIFLRLSCFTLLFAKT
jgi:hypothetical protein